MENSWETSTIILISFAVLMIIVICIDFIIKGGKWRGTMTDHFNGKRFMNMGWTRQDVEQFENDDKTTHYVYGFLRFIFARRINNWQKKKITPVQVKKYHDGEDFVITYIGHATLLIQIKGINIITDPVYSHRASPFRFIGPERFIEPGIQFSDLPPIDVILLSHNHYDHMDIETLRAFYDRGDNPRIYTGLGNSDYMMKRGIQHTIDMDWWDQVLYTKNGEEVKIHFVPAQHFSSRSITDRNKTLWGGFVVQIGEKKLYFAGDTGYGEFVYKIAEKYPNGFDVGLLPIGAYNPRWMLQKVHTGPREALRMQKELKIQKGIAIHWGVFPLADDKPDDPLQELRLMKKREEYKNTDLQAEFPGYMWTI